jgi:type IV secretory pathway TrbD component
MPVAFEQHPLLKTVCGVSAIACPYRGSENRRRLCNPAPRETVIMNPRLAAVAAFCREVAIPASVLAWIVAFGSAGIDNTGAAPIVERPAPSLAAVARFADNLPPISLAAADAVAASRSVTETAAAEATPASREPEPIVTAALTDSSEMLPPETSPEQPAKSLAIREPAGANPAVDSTEVFDECIVVDTCIDRYLWVLYQRTPKEDSIKTQEHRKVTVRKKGRLVTVTRTFTTLADEDFSWKDPKAAARAGMSMADYVIGGMDRDFKLKLFHMLHAAEQAGLSPGITSAFRDDYRQSIASGLKAANDRSYHGGSFRGGYGHGLAADVVSVNGATRAQRFTSTETLWKWIDAHGQESGIGRPYLDRDPPHVAPIDGKEYADHHPGIKARRVGSAAKPRGRLTSQDDRRSAKPARAAKSSKMKTIRPA